MEAINKFYEKYPFPGIRPIDQDGLVLLRSLVRFIQSDGRKRSQTSMRILDAGCGTGNTIVSLARNFIRHSFLGVDLSKHSLSIAEKSAKKEKLQNIHFRTWDLMKPLKGENSFDIILCLGVLHHTADMKNVLSNLRNVLMPEGELYLWIYGKHGRHRHVLNQQLLSMLTDINSLSAESIRVAKEFALTERKGSILNDLAGHNESNSMFKEVLENDIWIADQFLNPRETLLDMKELIELSDSAGFKIKKWLGVNEDLASYFDSNLLAQRFIQFSPTQKYMALDLLLKPEQYFVVLQNV